MRVGQLSTPVGTLQLSVAYRTKMTISPQHTGRDTSIMLKSDHFRPDLSPRIVTRRERYTNFNFMHRLAILFTLNFWCRLFLLIK